MLAAWLFRFFAWLCITLPEQNIKLIIDLLSSLYYRLDFRKRHHVKKNLSVILNDSEKISQLTPKVYQHFGYFLYEFFSKKTFEMKSKSFLSPHTVLGNPGEHSSLILTGHYGNWELGLRHLLNLGYKVSTITMHHSHSKVDHFFDEMRQHPNLTCHDLEKGLQPIMRSIQNKHIVALACERDYTQRGFQFEFMNSEIKFPKGPAYLIKKFKRPTFIFSQERTNLLSFNYDLIPLSFNSEAESLEMLSYRVAKEVFRVILNKPEQWLTFDPYFIDSMKKK